MHFHKKNLTKSFFRKQPLTFDEVNAAALPALASLLSSWLPDGRMTGDEYVARNPLRSDRKKGSFKINIRTGRWSDFATGDRGGDPVSLYAYLNGCDQITALYYLAEKLGV